MSGRIPEAFIGDLLNRVDIADLIGSRVVLKRAGAEFKACCPFHDEKTPSFTVSPVKQFYHCFGCGAHGTAITFLMEHDGLDFVEAVEDLAGQCGLQVPREGSAGATDATQTRRGNAEILERQEQASRYFQQQLRSHPQASRVIEYLKSRGLTGETAASFRLGFAPAGWRNLIAAIGSGSEPALVEAGLAIRRDDGGAYDRFRDRLMFPILDSRGRTVGFGGRTLGDDNPKYLNSPETAVFHKGQELYGLHTALRVERHPRRAVVVEGYMDVIALAQHGIPCPVATLGTAPTPQHLQRLFRVTDRIVFCFDGDDAGRRAAQRAMEISLAMLRDGRRVEFAFLPEKADPDSQVRESGSEAFEVFLDQAMPLSEFLFKRLLEQTDLNSLDGRARLVELARPSLAKVPAGTFREMLLTRIGELAQLPTDQVRRMIASGSTTGTDRRRQDAGTRPAAGLELAPLVAKALRLLLAEPRSLESVHKVDTPDALDLPGMPLLRAVMQQLRADQAATAATLLERYRGKPEGVTLARLVRLGPGGIDGSIQHSAPPLTADQTAVELADAFAAMRRLGARQRRRELTSKRTLTALSEKEKLELRRPRSETTS